MISQRQFEKMALIKAGRYEEAIALAEQIFAEGEAGPVADRASMNISLVNWRVMAEDHAPARDSLMRVRDGQAGLLLSGDFYYGEREAAAPAENWRRIERFRLILEMNDILEDSASTYDIFVKLESLYPDLAQRHARGALPAMVAACDFTRAERYSRAPLEQLGAVNQAAQSLALFPPHPAAPRLAADLINLVQRVRLRAATLAGLGREDEAETLHAALMAGLASDELRHHAQREFDEPGAVTRESVTRAMATEGQTGFESSP